VQQKLEHEDRVAVRVAVRRDSGIDATLLVDGEPLPVAVGDISVEGMFITLERGRLAAQRTLKVGSLVEVEVIFDGEKMCMRGAIRSEHDGGYGIFFPPRDRLGRPNPLARFERISEFLQRTSRTQRLNISNPPK